MFDLFKKKPDKTKVAVDVCSNVLQVQLALGGNPRAERLLSDRFALGYVFGFHDSILQCFEIGQDAQGFAALAASYEWLFRAESAGAEVLRTSFGLQQDQQFMKGMFAGGQEARDYVRTEKPPLGLPSYLQGGA